MNVEKRGASRTVGFRRNIKWFLAALFGFLITLILVLLLFLQSVLGTAAANEASLRRLAAKAAHDAVEAAGPDASPSVLEGGFAALRGSFDLAGLELRRNDGTIVRSGIQTESSDTLERSVSNGVLTLHFFPSAVEPIRSRFLWIAAIILGSTAIAGVLLVLLLPRIVRPIDLMLEDARELGERDERLAEDRYLIETFRSSIDRLREQEQELRRLHEFEKARADDLERITATLTRSLSSGFIALDPEGKVIDLNRAAREILQLDDPSGLPSRIDQAIGPGPMAETLRGVFDTRTSLSRYEIVDPSRKLIVGLTTVPLYGEDDGFLGMLVLFTDLSNVRDLEQRMREMQALADLGQISAGIAHEFRNSLGTILGYLKLARRQSDLQAHEEKIRQAEAEGQRLAESISALLAFARPVSLQIETIDLSGLLRRIAERLTPENGPIQIAISGDPVEIDGDNALLETVFENLVRNSVEAITPGRSGHVRITLQTADDQAWVEVEDDGEGIPEDLVSRVFLPFQTGKASGTGLGLALARKIVLLHEGTISIESQPGRGTTVRVSLPRRHSAT